MPTCEDFVLQGGDKEFANRQKLMFDKLSVVEKAYRRSFPRLSCADVDTDIAESLVAQPRTIGKKLRVATKKYRGQESIFKRPDVPLPRTSFRGIPDHKRNPHKWVKYSLEDVSNDDMTDKSNTQAALSFLKELKARKKTERAHKPLEKMDIDETESNKNSVIFRKPKKIKVDPQIEFRKVDKDEESPGSSAAVVDHDDKPMYRNSKVIMPEYIVGRKQKKKRKREIRVVKIGCVSQLKLDHLEDIEDEED